MNSSQLMASLTAVIAVSAVVTPCPAAVCTVPSAAHPTIQEAVNDLACTEIDIDAGSFFEEVVVARDLDLGGASSATTVVEGRVVVEGATTQVALRDLTIDASGPTAAGCFDQALLSRGGAQLGASDVIVLNGGGDACVLFRDGFETGDTTAWSGTVP